MGAIETRVKYLETVVDKLLINPSNKMSEDNSDIKEVPVAEVKAKPNPPASGSFELVLKQYRVPHPTNGTLMLVNAEVLQKDPALLSMMREKYPACFK